MATIGFVGLGAMGAPMARRLLKSQHSVIVFARRAEAMAPLVNAGARAAASPAAVASASDIVCIMVTDTEAVEQVIRGSQGIVHGAHDGLVVIDHSTIVPARAKRLAADLRARGIFMLDAPVSGGVAAAEAGTLSIMVGGDAAAYERCRPILSAFGQTITHMGESGAGQVAKACNQICTIVNQDDGKVESRLHHKDILIVLEMARELGIDLPASAVAAGALTELQARGGAKKDSAAVFSILDRPD